jgi:zinc protease
MIERRVRLRDLAESTVKSGKLDNGVGWAVWPDARDAVLTVQIWVRVGSRDEQPNKTGLAHMLEHLMFRGTETVPDGQFDARMERMGASINAATWVDYTYYTTTVQPGALRTVLELEADRFANLKLVDDVFTAERSVVANERRDSVDASPEARLGEHFHQRALAGSPYSWPTIGWTEDIANYTLSDVIAFYHEHYAADRLLVTVCGNVDVTTVVSMLGETFGNLDRRSHGRPDRAGAFVAGVRDSLPLPISSPRALVAWSAPARVDRRYAVRFALCELLAGSESARLVHRLEVERSLCLDVSMYTYPHDLESMTELRLTLRPGVRAQRVTDIVFAELEALAATPPPAAELERVVRRMLTQDAMALASTTTRATWMGESWIGFDNATGAFALVDDIAAVTPADISAEAARLAVRSSASVCHATLAPRTEAA